MSRRRKSLPRDVQEAQQRVNGMKSVDERLDLGNGISVGTFTTAIQQVTDEIAAYNMLLAEVDARSNRIDAGIKTINEFSKRALTAAAYKYGDDSDEYEMIGGTRKSDRKRPSHKNKGGTGAMK